MTTKTIKNVVVGFVALLLFNGAIAQSSPPAELETEYVFTIEADIDKSIVMGESVDGIRQSIPITGGKFYGDDLRGKILPGGADYQLRRSDGSTVLRAVYMIQTDDGALINVVNEGVIVPATDSKPMYFRTSPKFTAPNGKYSWLNQHIFVCGVRRDAERPGTVIIDVYKLK